MIPSLRSQGFGRNAMFAIHGCRMSVWALFALWQRMVYCHATARLAASVETAVSFCERSETARGRPGPDLRVVVEAAMSYSPIARGEDWT